VEISIITGRNNCIGIGLLVRKKKQKKKLRRRVYKTPIERATSLLTKRKLWQKGEVKEYYSELTDMLETILRKQ
jgi:hypothetical protein